MHVEKIKEGRNKGNYMVCDDATGTCKIVTPQEVEKLRKETQQKNDWHH